MPEKILTALALDRVAPGVLAGHEIAGARASIEAMMLALARSTGTSLEDVRKMPLWQIVRYLNKLTEKPPK